jgi:hypothetical protein
MPNEELGESLESLEDFYEEWTDKFKKLSGMATNS